MQCERCEKTFKTISKLREHTSNRQTPCRPATYHCPVCAKGFASYQSLWNHKRGCKGKSATLPITVSIIGEKRTSVITNESKNRTPKNPKIEAPVDAFINNDTHPTSQKKLTAEPSTPKLEVLPKNHDKLEHQPKFQKLGDTFFNDNQEVLDNQKRIKSNKTSETAEVFLPPRICNNANTSGLKNNVPTKKILPGEINDETTKEVQISLQKHNSKKRIHFGHEEALSSQSSNYSIQK